jgi:F0F1-type ATP synthase assembly protein I
MPDEDARSRRWALIGLLIYGACAGVVLLAPVSYSGIVHAIDSWLRSALGLTWFGSGWVEFIANILLFVPLGFLLTLIARPHWLGVVVGLLVSAGVELVQIVIPSREASLRDVLANTCGAAVGAVLAWLLLQARVARTRRSAVGEPEAD